MKPFKILIVSLAIVLVLAVTGCCCCYSGSTSSGSTHSNDITSSTNIVTPTNIPSDIPTLTPTPTFTLKLHGNFSDSSNYAKPGTYENTLVSYLDAIYEHDYNKLLSLTSPSWVKAQNERYSNLEIEDIKPINIMKIKYEYVYLEGYEIKEYIPKGSSKVEAHINVYMRFPDPESELWHIPVTVTLNKESGKFYISDYNTDVYSKPWS